MTKRLFDHGRIFITPAAFDALEESGRALGDDRNAPEILLHMLACHISGEWGDLSAEDKRANRDALKTGARILSSYKTPGTQTTIWLITEADRSATTILLPDDY